MGDHQHRYALPVQPPQKLHDLGVVAEVLPGGGLVQDDDVRAKRQHAGDGHPLFLAEAQGAHRPVAEGIEPADLQRVLHLRAHFVGGKAALHKTQGHLVVDHGLGDHLVGVLHDIPDPPRPLADGVAGDVPPVQQDGAGAGGLKAADEL